VIDHLTASASSCVVKRSSITANCKDPEWSKGLAMATIEQSEKVITVEAEEGKVSSPVKRKSETSESTLVTPAKKVLKTSVEEEDSNLPALEGEGEGKPEDGKTEEKSDADEKEKKENGAEDGNNELQEIDTADEADGEGNEEQEENKDVDGEEGIAETAPALSEEDASN